MYHYLLTCYQQWCNGQGEPDIIKGGERFIDMVHKILSYNKDETRRFLIRQPWFRSEVDKELL